MHDLLERLSLAIDVLLDYGERGEAMPAYKARELGQVAHEALLALSEHPELGAVEYGDPDPVENARVTQALIDGGTIRAGARVLGVSTHRMKHLIIQHRVQWPRKP